MRRIFIADGKIVGDYKAHDTTVGDDLASSALRSGCVLFKVDGVLNGMLTYHSLGRSEASPSACLW